MALGILLEAELNPIDVNNPTVVFFIKDGSELEHTMTKIGPAVAWQLRMLVGEVDDSRTEDDHVLAFVLLDVRICYSWSILSMLRIFCRIL